MKPLAVDFLVLGGGPSGAAFAILTARAGAAVALVERRGYGDPRPGEHIAGKVRGALDALKIPPAAMDGITMASPGIVSLWHGGAPLIKPFHAMGGAPGLRVVRNRFDAALFQAAGEAGAVTFAPARVGRPERRDGRWKAAIDSGNGEPVAVSAAMVIDATGRAAGFSRWAGARRIAEGDLIAIVSWFEQEAARPNGGMLAVQSGPFGWWSASATADGMLAVSLYTSAAMAKAGGPSLAAWWNQALSASPYVRRLIEIGDAVLVLRRVFPALPSRSAPMHGEGWIAIGEAAAAFDPICGQGVAYAMEGAFRAFDIARLDMDWNAIGPIYEEAWTSRYEEHLLSRAAVYREAPDLPEAFFAYAL